MNKYKLEQDEPFKDPEPNEPDKTPTTPPDEPNPYPVIDPLPGDEPMPTPPEPNPEYPPDVVF